jgi:hypothetical protein
MALREHVGALFTDLYEVTMAQAYLAKEMSGTDVFETFFRKLPRSRSYVLAAGVADMTLVTASSLVECRGFDAEHMAQTMAAQYDASRGAATARPLRTCCCRARFAIASPRPRRDNEDLRSPAASVLPGRMALVDDHAVAAREFVALLAEGELDLASNAVRELSRSPAGGQRAGVATRVDRQEQGREAIVTAIGQQ